MYVSGSADQLALHDVLWSWVSGSGRKRAYQRDGAPVQSSAYGIDRHSICPVDRSDELPSCP